MNKLLIAAALALMAAGVQAAQFSGLQTIKAAELKTDNADIALPGTPIKALKNNTLAAQQALADLDKLPGATRFEKLSNLFQTGIPAVKEDLAGWHAGRYVNSINPDQFTGKLLIGVESPMGWPTGTFGTGNAHNQLPEFYDNMSAEDIDCIQEDYTLSTQVYFPEAGGTWAYADNRGELTYRKVNGYIIEKAYAREGYGTHGKWETAYTFYFLTVTPRGK